MWSQCPKQLELYPLGIKINLIWWFSYSSPPCLLILQTAPHGIPSVLPLMVRSWRNPELGISPHSFPSGCDFLPALSEAEEVMTLNLSGH